jgi:DNA invertase Pin-like site-specific DNA recombinase
MKRAALYLRVSTLEQNSETQGIELRLFARQRGYEVTQEYVDHGVSGTKVRRPALDQLLKDAHRRKFDAVLVWSCDRLARSTKHFLEVLDELNELGIQFHSQREAIDPEGPLGRAIVVIISAIAELERSLIVERVRAGMRRAKLAAASAILLRRQQAREIAKTQRPCSAMRTADSPRAYQRVRVTRSFSSAGGCLSSITDYE